jgi:hypothetical protein
MVIGRATHDYRAPETHNHCMVKCQRARGSSWSHPKRAAGLMKSRLHKSQCEQAAGWASSLVPRLGLLASPIGPATLFKMIALVSPQAALGTPAAAESLGAPFASAPAMPDDGPRASATSRTSLTLRRAALGDEVDEEDEVEEDMEEEEEEREEKEGEGVPCCRRARTPSRDVGSSFLMTRSPASASF